VLPRYSRKPPSSWQGLVPPSNLFEDFCCPILSHKVCCFLLSPPHVHSLLLLGWVSSGSSPFPCLLKAVLRLGKDEVFYSSSRYRPQLETIFYFSVQKKDLSYSEPNWWPRSPDSILPDDEVFTLVNAQLHEGIFFFSRFQIRWLPFGPWRSLRGQLLVLAPLVVSWFPIGV